MMDASVRENGGVVCSICSGKKSWLFRYATDDGVESEISAFGSGAKYCWRLCRSCGNGYPSFMPDLQILAKFWENNRVLSDTDNDRQEEVWSYRKTISKRGARRSYDFFAPLHAKQVGRFLDIGCGLGETVKLFADHGWDAMGVDADPSMRRFHEIIGINSKIGQVEALNFDGKFDVIHTAHAIYFVTNVRAFIAKLRDNLAPDGLLCVVLANFLKSDDPSLPCYAHSFYPTENSMRYLLALEGFQVVFSKKKSGSIFLAARVAAGPLPDVHPWLIRLGHESKPLRYALFGRPITALKSAIKRLLSIARPAA